MDALIDAAELKGVEIWEDHDKPTIHFSRRGIARLFTLAGTMSLRVRTDSKRALANSIAAVLAHPDCPVRLYNEIADFINDEWSDIAAAEMKQAPLIEKALERGGCGYVLCPGSEGGVCPGPGSHAERKGGAR